MNIFAGLLVSIMITVPFAFFTYLGFKCMPFVIAGLIRSGRGLNALGSFCGWATVSFLELIEPYAKTFFSVLWTVIVCIAPFLSWAALVLIARAIFHDLSVKELLIFIAVTLVFNSYRNK